MSDLQIGGSILLALSVIFSFVNGFLIWLAFCKNWTAITRSKFFNSFFLGVLIIALMSLDSFFHIMFPFRYEAGYESRRKVHIACILAAAITFAFKIAPGLALLKENNSTMSCTEYKDPDASTHEEIMNKTLFFVPLNCHISLPKGEQEIVRADAALSATIIAVSWFILLSTNVACLLIALRKLWNSPARSSLTQTARATLLICSISFTFMLSNFPIVVLWLMNYHAMRGYKDTKTANVTEKVHFYITLLSFLSLIFHPWFFVLRLKSFRELLIRFKMRVVRSVRTSQSLRMSSISFPATTNKTRFDTDKSVDSVDLKKVGEQVVLSNKSASEETV
ncbi:hypothetical protein ACHWQZ_G013606 [Mnemiopsis leidyi]